MNLRWLVFLCLCAAIVAFVVADAVFGLDPSQAASVVALLAVLVTVGVGSFSRYAGRSPLALKHAALWLTITAVFALVATAFPEIINP